MKRARSWWQQLTATTKVGYVAIWLYGYMAMAIAPGQGSGVSGWQSGKVVWHKVWCRVDCGFYVIGMPFCMWLGVTKQQPITKYEK